MPTCGRKIGFIAISPIRWRRTRNSNSTATTSMRRPISVKSSSAEEFSIMPIAHGSGQAKHVTIMQASCTCSAKWPTCTSPNVLKLKVPAVMPPRSAAQENILQSGDAEDGFILTRISTRPSNFRDLRVGLKVAVFLGAAPHAARKSRVLHPARQAHSRGRRVAEHQRRPRRDPSWRRRRETAG